MNILVQLLRNINRRLSFDCLGFEYLVSIVFFSNDRRLQFKRSIILFSSQRLRLVSNVQ